MLSLAMQDYLVLCNLSQGTEVEGGRMTGQQGGSEECDLHWKVVVLFIFDYQIRILY